MSYDVVWCRCVRVCVVVVVFFFFQAEDGIRDLVRSRGLGDVYKRQRPSCASRSTRTVPCCGVWLFNVAARPLPPEWSVGGVVSARRST